MAISGFAIAFSLLCYAAARDLSVTVADSSKQPITGVTVQVKAGQRIVASAETDSQGLASFPNLGTGAYEIAAAKDGFESAIKKGIQLSQDSVAAIQITLLPAVRHESVEVAGTAGAVAQGSSAPTALQTQSVKELPSRPATVADALPLVPGVVRAPDGAIQISASPEHRSALIVNWPTSPTPLPGNSD